MSNEGPNAFSFADSFAASHPKETGEVLSELDPKEVAAFLGALNDEVADALTEEMRLGTLAEILQHLPHEKVAGWITAAAPKRQTDMFRALNEKMRSAVLPHLPDVLAGQLARQTGTNLETVDAWYEHTALTFPAETTVRDVIKTCRRPGKGKQSDRLIVLNESKSVLGVVRLSDVLAARDDTPIADVERLTTVRLKASKALVNILSLDDWENTDVLPVVDQHGHFLGVLSFARLMEALDMIAPRSEPMAQSAFLWESLDALTVVVAGVFGMQTPLGLARRTRLREG